MEMKYVKRQQTKVTALIDKSAQVTRELSEVCLLVVDGL